MHEGINTSKNKVQVDENTKWRRFVMFQTLLAEYLIGNTLKLTALGKRKKKQPRNRETKKRRKKRKPKENDKGPCTKYVTLLGGGGVIPSVTLHV